MFTGREIAATLTELGVTHVIWVPDSEMGTWEAELEAAEALTLLRVCREGEAWPLEEGAYRVAQVLQERLHVDFLSHPSRVRGAIVIRKDGWSR